MTDRWFRTAVESAPDCILIIDGEGKIVFANPRTASLFGWSNNELIGREIEVLVADEVKEKHRGLAKQFLRNPMVRPMGLARNLQGRHRDGHLIPVEISLSPNQFSEDNFLIAIVRDVTERLRIEQNVREGQEILGTFFEMSPAGLVVASSEKIVTRVNQAYLTLLGWESSQVRQHPVIDFIFPEDRLQFAAKMDELSPDSGSRDIEIRGLRPDGRPLWLRIGMCLIPKQGERSQYLLTFIDITSQKEIEQALMARANELKKSNLQLEEFATVASHDLRAPARRAATLLQLFSQEHAAQLDPEGKKILGFAVGEVIKLQETVRDLLEYSKVCGAEPLPLIPVDLNDVVNSTLETMRDEIERKGAKITCEKLPTVDGNPVQLRRLFANLFSNSLKFNRGTPSVHIATDELNGKQVVRVRDNGVGIDPHHLQRVFEIFFRAHNDSVFPGTGVGLASCKRIMENHGGYITVTSEPGAGYFPLPYGSGERLASVRATVSR